MIEHIDAIYDNGVLRLLQPLPLPDQSRVTLSVDPSPQLSSDSETLRLQQAALDELRAAVEALPKSSNNDGWSVRRHDELLYGGER